MLICSLISSLAFFPVCGILYSNVKLHLESQLFVCRKCFIVCRIDWLLVGYTRSQAAKQA